MTCSTVEISAQLILDMIAPGKSLTLVGLQAGAGGAFGDRVVLTFEHDHDDIPAGDVRQIMRQFTGVIGQGRGSTVTVFDKFEACPIAAHQIDLGKEHRVHVEFIDSGMLSAAMRKIEAAIERGMHDSFARGGVIEPGKFGLAGRDGPEAIFPNHKVQLQSYDGARGEGDTRVNIRGVVNGKLVEFEGKTEEFEQLDLHFCQTETQGARIAELMRNRVLGRADEAAIYAWDAETLEAETNAADVLAPAASALDPAKVWAAVEATAKGSMLP